MPGELTPAARFAKDLARIWPEGAPRRGDPPVLGIAVSGGADSLALLLLAAEARPGGVAAATVDHGLRPESAAEAAMVAEVCARLGVPHATVNVTVPAGNVQAEARTARYAALAEWMAEAAVGAIATAHHADDQAETLLMRLNRASGVAGLAGVRPRGGVPGAGDRLLLRPLLGWRRAELAAVVAAGGLDPAQDPSNHDPAYDRVRVRAALAGAEWLDVAALAESAGHLADADGALDWAAAREWQESVARDGPGISYRPQAPRAVALRVMARIVRDLAGAAPRGGAVADVFDALVAGRPASIGDLVARPGVAGWSFMPAPRRRIVQKDG